MPLLTSVHSKIMYKYIRSTEE